MPEPLRPIGFWSYTSSDDRNSNGRLSQWRVLLTNALQLEIGQRPVVHIFQDVSAIPQGSEWEVEIHKALGQSCFLIPIVTPGFLQSPWCCAEVKRFREREISLGRSDLIFPLQYIDTTDIDPDIPEDCHDPAVLRLLRARQRTDFRDLRFRDPGKEEVSERIAALAFAIRSALRRTVTVPATASAGAVPHGLDQVPVAAEPKAHVPVIDASAGAETAPLPAVGTASPSATAQDASAPPGSGALPEADAPPAAALEPLADPGQSNTWHPMRRWAAVLIGCAVLAVVGYFVLPGGNHLPPLAGNPAVGPAPSSSSSAPAGATQPPSTSPPVSSGAAGQPPASSASLTPADAAQLPPPPPLPPPQRTNDAAQASTGSPPTPAVFSTIRDCATCPELVLLPAGSFTMGVPPAEEKQEKVPDYWQHQSEPLLKPTPHSFYMGKYAVTRDEYAEFFKEQGASLEKGDCWSFAADKDGHRSWAQKPGLSWRDPGFALTETPGRHPAVCVSQKDAEAYVKWLSHKTGKTYYLPSEVEWEYAARAVTSASAPTFARYWGDDRGQADRGPEACLNANVADLALARQMNVAKPDPDLFFACDDKFAFTAPVGRFQANAFGLFDMLGNVQQWTGDCWHDNYKEPPPMDGSPWNKTGDCGRRVLRGGSWDDDPWLVRAGFRFWDVTGYRGTTVGFRLARTR